jgi:DNA-binding protein Fis
MRQFFAKALKQLKGLPAWAIYRLMRKDLLRRMLNTGMSWAACNKVLEACGQKVVTHYQVNEDKTGVILGFNKAKQRKAPPKQKFK